MVRVDLEVPAVHLLGNLELEVLLPAAVLPETSVRRQSHLPRSRLA